jgi:hypothetical protein
MPYRVKSVEVHATGLRLPTHLGLTNDAQLLVSEFAGSAVRDVTKPGDYGDCGKGEYLRGLSYPGGILPLSSGKVIVADSGAGAVYDVTRSGDVSRQSALFDGIPNPYGLVELRDRIYVSFFEEGSLGIAVLEEGESFDHDRAFVSRFPCATTAEPFPQVEAYGGSWPAARRGDQLLLGHSSLGTIWDVTHGGTFDDLRNERFAWGLDAPGGMIADPLDDELYVVERRTGVVRRIADPGYARFAEPLLAGFHEPSCLRFTEDGRELFVADKAWGAIYRIELEHEW